jgi:hypothetical protein
MKEKVDGEEEQGGVVLVCDCEISSRPGENSCKICPQIICMIIWNYETFLKYFFKEKYFSDKNHILF